MTSENSRETIDTLIHARWIIPATEDQAILEHHSLAVRDGRIVAIVPQDEARRQYQAAQEYTLDAHALIPGLVNAHGHAGMTLLRGVADDQPLHTWLQEHIWPLEQRWVSEAFVYDGTRLAMAEMLRGGTTCFADMYFFPDAVARAALQANIRVQLASPILDFPTQWGTGPEDYINKAARLHDEYRNSQLISLAFGPHAPYTISDEPLTKLATLAEELDIPIHMHIHETRQEVEDAVSQTGKRPLQRLDELGLLSPRLICVHATQLNDDEIQRLADSGTHVAHCPQSNLKLASGFCPVHRLQQAGVNVILGTDGAASNNDLDMISEMQSAALLAKAVAEDASALPAYEALRMATINGARAMGLDEHIGSLEIGKFADLAAVRLDAINTLPVYNPVSQLVYSSQSNQVSHVWVGGKIAVDDGVLCHINLSVLREKSSEWQQKLSQESA